jgi:hypothetical protein
MRVLIALLTLILCTPSALAAPLRVTTAPVRLPLVADETILLDLTLHGAGQDILSPKDLSLTHTKYIHVLAIDPSLTDYHHLHPVYNTQTKTFRVDFTPETAGPYRIYVQAARADGTALNASVDVGGAFTVEDTSLLSGNTQAMVGGYHFFLLPQVGGTPAGHGLPLILQVMKDDHGVETLEPILGAFAHIVAFSLTDGAVAHTHPGGKEPTDDRARGGPQLPFYLAPPPGAHRLAVFAQVKIDGQVITVPFVINIPHSI